MPDAVLPWAGLAIGLHDDGAPDGSSSNATAFGMLGRGPGGFSLLFGGPMLVHGIAGPPEKRAAWVPAVDVAPSRVSVGWTF